MRIRTKSVFDNYSLRSISTGHGHFFTLVLASDTLCNDEKLIQILLVIGALLVDQRAPKNVPCQSTSSGDAHSIVAIVRVDHLSPSAEHVTVTRCAHRWAALVQDCNR